MITENKTFDDGGYVSVRLYNCIHSVFEKHACGERERERGRERGREKREGRGERGEEREGRERGGEREGRG